MRRLAILPFTLVIVLSSTLSCSQRYGPQQLTGPIGAVHFDLWVKYINNTRRGVNDSVGYVIRKSGRGELIFSVKRGFAGEARGNDVTEFPVKDPNYDYYSDNRFAVSLDGAFRIREATIDEWDTAEKPLHSYHFIGFFDKQHTGDGVQFKGRLYRKSGESWGKLVALVSPRETWIAIFSYSSRDKPDQGWLPGFKSGATEPGRGEVFLDIYNISSGARVISARSPYGQAGGFEPSMLFRSSLWVEDRYFIMPLNFWLEDCFVGVLPEK